MTMSRRSLIAATALTTFAASRAWPQAPQPGPAPATRTPLRTRPAGRFTGDFDELLDRRLRSRLRRVRTHRCSRRNQTDSCFALMQINHDRGKGVVLV
jgi:hypothetical protein